jgi:hypothetical protein
LRFAGGKEAAPFGIELNQFALYYGFDGASNLASIERIPIPLKPHHYLIDKRFLWVSISWNG